ncbi:Protein of unknown function [Pyronema omphalodes CBS 100304]|uniref:Uncharacterized protein n=1 Tax=Pyronema omphalodes (strain CBS 100304) TaxID=1076935 RepID=U4LRE0_PYROM|nr:Protein of unknown function [Pyronema omphalodes CBS 100304]
MARTPPAPAANTQAVAGRGSRAEAAARVGRAGGQLSSSTHHSRCYYPRGQAGGLEGHVKADGSISEEEEGVC